MSNRRVAEVSSKLTDTAVSGLGGHATFPLRQRLYRLVWMITWALLASYSPPQMRAWRRGLLRAFGARVDSTAGVRGSAKIWYPPNLILGPGSSIGPRVRIYNVNLIEISADTVVSQDAHLCTASHDFRTHAFLLTSRPIKIGNNVWIAAESFVGPGVTIGDGAILGARAAAFADLAPWTIYRGNPAKAVKQRQQF